MTDEQVTVSFTRDRSYVRTERLVVRHDEPDQGVLPDLMALVIDCRTTPLR
jgi:hypothetical protein